MARIIAERADVIPMLAEIFREHGFEGASLAIITERTGLGKGSLYNFFPGGKEEMAAACLAEIDAWFENNMYRPLREESDAEAAIAAMLAATDSYFRTGRRVCLIGVFALADIRDRFAATVNSYFRRWVDALASALQRAGWSAQRAAPAAEDAVAAIQGAIVLARALDEIAPFARCLDRLGEQLIPGRNWRAGAATPPPVIR
jgi:TetR/AcrR family transcriptional repressor of lmrAB and yxaGH operons